MSIFQIVKVWEHEFTAPQQIVMLAMADHAHDDGTSVKPGLERVAWKTGYSLRHMKRIVKELAETGVLVLVRNHGDGKPREYRIDWSAAKAKVPYEAKGDILSSEAKVTPRVSKGDIPGTPKVTPRVSKGDIPGTPKVTPRVSKGDIAMSPEPSEPSLNRQEPSDIHKGKKSDQKDLVKAQNLFDIYNAEKPPTWKTATTLNEKRRRGLRTLISEHGEATLRIFRAALVFARSDEWWSAKDLTLETLLAKNRVLEWSEKGEQQKPETAKPNYDDEPSMEQLLSGPLEGKWGKR